MPIKKIRKDTNRPKICLIMPFFGIFTKVKWKIGYLPFQLKLPESRFVVLLVHYYLSSCIGTCPIHLTIEGIYVLLGTTKGTQCI